MTRLTYVDIHSPEAPELDAASDTATGSVNLPDDLTCVSPAAPIGSYRLSPMLKQTGTNERSELGLRLRLEAAPAGVLGHGAIVA